MIKRIYSALKQDDRFTEALRWYLIWGFGVRTFLLIGLTILLVIEGNFLLEWLLSWGLVKTSQENLADITVASYVVIGGLLLVGIALRAGLLHRMGEFEHPDGEPTPNGERPEAA